MGQPVRNATCDRLYSGFIALVLSVVIGASASGTQIRGKADRGPFGGDRLRSASVEAVPTLSHRVSLMALQNAPETVGMHTGSTTGTKKISLPEGPGKMLATQYCQDCHSLADLTGAHKQAEQWRKTVVTMIDRGARLPPDKIDILVDYLAKNFAPAKAASGGPSTASGGKAAGLPEGPGKAIAIQYCQSCHSMTLVTRARKSAPEWRQSIQKMVFFGSTLPKQDVEPLTRYLAKNFGPQK